MISAEQLRDAIREGRITQDEESRLIQVLGEIIFRLWYETETASPNTYKRRPLCRL